MPIYTYEGSDDIASVPLIRVAAGTDSSLVIIELQVWTRNPLSSQQMEFGWQVPDAATPGTFATTISAQKRWPGDPAAQCTVQTGVSSPAAYTDDTLVYERQPEDLSERSFIYRPEPGTGIAVGGGQKKDFLMIYQGDTEAAFTLRFVLKLQEGAIL